MYNTLRILGSRCQTNKTAIHVKRAVTKLLFEYLCYNTRAAHIEEDVSRVYLPANDDVRINHAAIWGQPESDPSCGVDDDGKEKSVSEVIKGTVPTKSIVLVEVFASVVLVLNVLSTNADKQREKHQRQNRPHGG